MSPPNSSRCIIPEYLVKIGQGDQWVGSGFALDPLIIVTCLHVVVSGGITEDNITLQQAGIRFEAGVKGIFRHTANDIAIIFLVSPLRCSEFPKLCLFSNNTEFSDTFSYLSFGWPLRRKADDKVQYFYLNAQDMNYQKFLEDGSDQVTKLRIHKAAEEGMSGGPLIARAKLESYKSSQDYLLGMNYYGGNGAGSGEYIAAAAIAQFYLDCQRKLKCSPNNTITLGEEVFGQQKRSLHAKQQDFARLHRCHPIIHWRSLAFAFVPPGKNEHGYCDTAVYVQVAPMAIREMQNLLGGYEYSPVESNFSTVYRLIHELCSKETPCRLLTETEWAYLFVGEEINALPSKAKHAGRPVRSKQVYQDVAHPLGLYAPCPRRYEVVSSFNRLKACAAVSTPSCKFGEVLFNNAEQVNDRLVFRCVLELSVS